MSSTPRQDQVDIRIHVERSAMDRYIVPASAIILDAHNEGHTLVFWWRDDRERVFTTFPNLRTVSTVRETFEARLMSGEQPGLSTRLTS